MAAWIKMPHGIEVGLGPGDFVLDEDPAPPSLKRGRSPPPQFLAHVYCGQTAGRIKMALDMEVGLSPAEFVLDSDRAPTPKNSLHNFWPIFIVAKRLDASRCNLVWK